MQWPDAQNNDWNRFDHVKQLLFLKIMLLSSNSQQFWIQQSFPYLTRYQEQHCLVSVYYDVLCKHANDLQIECNVARTNDFCWHFSYFSVSKIFWMWNYCVMWNSKICPNFLYRKTENSVPKCQYLKKKNWFLNHIWPTEKVSVHCWNFNYPISFNHQNVHTFFFNLYKFKFYIIWLLQYFNLDFS